jgi:hypothetical protein
VSTLCRRWTVRLRARVVVAVINPTFFQRAGRRWKSGSHSARFLVMVTASGAPSFRERQSGKVRDMAHLRTVTVKVLVWILIPILALVRVVRKLLNADTAFLNPPLALQIPMG